MGSVYEARHIDLEKRVALKTLSRGLAQTPLYVERFLREGRIAARLDHPHVVSVSDVGTTDDKTPFLVMALLDGRDLASLLAERGALPVEEAIGIILPILAALKVVHAAGLVHRDIKPANVFLCRSAHAEVHPKLLDFGIAKPTEKESIALTGTADMLGTPMYMAPEQIKSAKDAGVQADQYAIGIVLYECLTGSLPFELPPEATLYVVLAMAVAGEVRKPRVLVPSIPVTLEEIVLRSISVKPEDRFPSVTELGAALLPYASPAAKHMWRGVFVDGESGRWSAVRPTAEPAERAPISGFDPTMNLTAAKADVSQAVTPPSQSFAALPAPAVTPSLAVMPPSTSQTKRRNGSLLVMALLIISVAVGGIGLVVARGSRDSTPMTTTTMALDPAKTASSPSVTTSASEPTTPSSARSPDGSENMATGSASAIVTASASVAGASTIAGPRPRASAASPHPVSPRAGASSTASASTPSAPMPAAKPTSSSYRVD